GGGLGIDYAGSRSNTDSSKNYHTSEYAADIVQSLQQICDEENVPHPHIVSESGRAVTAHHSCVITNVVDVIKNFKEDLPTDICDNEHQILYNMRQTEKNLNAKNFQEMYHDAQAYREECTNAFKLGILELEERAKTETIYWHILEKINKLSKSANFIPQELEELDNRLAEKYLCNFSVFQSAADVWAIDQVLPIMPISRLNEEATQNCELVDITCDSDGKIKHFTHTSSSNNNSIKLHQLKENEPYYLGIFLTGAYQDVMGDMHNLFGRLNEIHVFSDPEDKSGFYIEEIIHGWNSDKILETMQYNPSSMAANIKKNIDAQIKKGLLTPRKGVKLIDFYEHCLKSTSYLKNDF
ncbi:MAG: biosynthetic arginine decarboxylase, partial [Lentisphaeraceae bacterium]|nr:biosynthetic arginine decarboxylase [Lentisphaeraceae bacterium]